MKKITIAICIGLGILLFIQGACIHSGTKGDQMKNDSTPVTFSSAAEAVNQARADLLQVMQMNKELDLGISDSGALATAVPGHAVRRFSIDFDKLLSADSAASLSALSQSEQNTIIPLLNNNQLVTVVELSHENDQWKIAALAGKAISEELRTVMGAINHDTAGMPPSDITLYEVPNLNAKLFSVTVGQSERVFTSYNGYSLRQAISASSIIPVLKENALRFQREFGDQLKKQKLVE